MGNNFKDGYMFLLNALLDKFVPKSEVNLTKPPFAEVLICKTGLKIN